MNLKEKKTIPKGKDIPKGIVWKVELKSPFKPNNKLIRFVWVDEPAPYLLNVALKCYTCSECYEITFRYHVKNIYSTSKRNSGYHVHSLWWSCWDPVLFQEKPMFTFANKAGLDMLETSLVALQDLTLDKIFDESGRKALFSDISKLMEQVRTAAVHPGIKSSFTSIWWIVAMLFSFECPYIWRVFPLF